MTKYNAWSVQTWKKAMINALSGHKRGTVFTKDEIIRLAVVWLVEHNIPKNAYNPNKNKDGFDILEKDKK